MFYFWIFVLYVDLKHIYEYSFHYYHLIVWNIK